MPQRFAVTVVLLLLGGSAAVAQGVDSAAFVRGLYLRYAGAEPDRGTVDVWVKELQKGTSANEVHAQILGSAQAFDYVRKDNDAWLGMLYAEILGRKPDATGFANWQKRLKDAKYDRVRLARDFLQSSGAELKAGGGNRPGVIAANELPAYLKTSSAELSQSVNSEFPGYDNFVVRQQAEVFAKSVSNYQTILNEPQNFPAKYAEGVNALSATLTSLEQSVAKSRLPAQSTRLHLDQNKQLLAALAQGGNVKPVEPGLPAVVPDGGMSQADARKLRKLLDTLENDAVAAEATFRAVIPQAWGSTRLINQLDDLAGDVDDLRQLTRAGIKPADFAARIQAVNTSAANINATVAASKLDVRAVQAWYAVTASLQTVNDEAGLKAVAPVGGGASADVLKAIDQAAAECDALAVAFGPYAVYNRAVPRLTADLQDLKNRYAGLRRAVNGRTPARRDLDAHLTGIADVMKSVNTNWREVNRDPRLSNTPDLLDLGTADRDVTKLVAAIK